MNKPLIAVAVCALVGSALGAQTTLHVAPGATGPGTSWAEAAGLHDALSRAAPGDELWLRAGTYLTSEDGDRAAAFRVPPGVKVHGGFAGTERSLAARDYRANATVLSGAIGARERSDNAYTVVLLEGADAETHLTGVTLSGAFANGAGPVADPKRAGGGVLLRLAAPGATSNPTFDHVTFEGNYARDGGAVYVDARSGTARPRFVGCTFRQNEADLDGGAVYNDGRRRGDASPTFVGCRFESNVANYGGAVFNQATQGKSCPRLSECAFASNHAYVRGAAIYNLDHRGENRVALVDCVFEDEAAATADGSVARGGE